MLSVNNCYPVPAAGLGQEAGSADPGGEYCMYGGPWAEAVSEMHLNVWFEDTYFVWGGLCLNIKLFVFSWRQGQSKWSYKVWSVLDAFSGLFKGLLGADVFFLFSSAHISFREEQCHQILEYWTLSFRVGLFLYSAPAVIGSHQVGTRLKCVFLLICSTS